MNQFMQASAGTWCRRGAWGVAVLSGLEIVLIIISRYAFPSVFSNDGPLGGYYFVSFLLQILGISVSGVFFTLVLSVFGLACDHYFGGRLPGRPEEATEEVEGEQ